MLNLDRLQDQIARQPVEDLPRTAAPDNAAYAIYTSGSTGKPKAVVVSHRSLVNHTLAVSRMYGISGADRRLQFASIGTDFFVAELFNYLCPGATLVFCLTGEGISVGEFLRLLDQQRITITGIPSTWWHEWVAVAAIGDFPPPSSLRAVITGMERVDAAAFATWNRIVGNRHRWFNAYGPTEATLTATLYEAGSSPWEGGAFVPIGRPIANTRAYVLDDDMNPVPVGVPGELYLGGAGVARGYLNAPSLTSQRFLPDPFRGNPESRLYRTGDLVFYLPDGNLVFLGRADRQVKIRGFRVELEEVEAVLAQHPAVRQCAVVVDGKEGQECLVAYVTQSEGQAVAPGQLRLHLSRYLPDQMLPAAFVTLREMPLTPSGKIDRQSLPHYQPERLHPEEDFQEPSTATEKRLAGLWQEVLGIARIGVTGNFFELGGDSLKATRLITLIHRQFGKELPLAVLLRAATPARMASVLEGDRDAPLWQSLVAIQGSGSKPPLFCMHALHGEVLFYRELAQHLGPDQPVYGLRSIGLDGARPPLETVEAMAAHYIREIRGLQPEGPYYLGGFCLGAYVALEVARQLQRDGLEVAMLACFDTDGQWRTSRSFPGGLAQQLRIFRGLGGRAKVGYVMERASYRLTRIKSTVVEVVCKLVEASGRPLNPALRRAHVREINLKASRAYEAGSFPGKLIYFQPASAPPADPAPFWGAIARGGLEVHLAPGRGVEMFQEPNASGLALGLSAALERARISFRTVGDSP